MHELSIAISIVEVAEEAAREQSGRVVAIHLKLGPLSGVVKEALLSSWPLACERSSLKGSRLEIEDVVIAGFCTQCGVVQPAESIQSMACQVCGTPMPDIRTGREMEIVALEISD